MRHSWLELSLLVLLLFRLLVLLLVSSLLGVRESGIWRIEVVKDVGEKVNECWLLDEEVSAGVVITIFYILVMDR